MRGSMPESVPFSVLYHVSLQQSGMRHGPAAGSDALILSESCSFCHMAVANCSTRERAQPCAKVPAGKVYLRFIPVSEARLRLCAAHLLSVIQDSKGCWESLLR